MTPAGGGADGSLTTLTRGPRPRPSPQALSPGPQRPGSGLIISIDQFIRQVIRQVIRIDQLMGLLIGGEQTGEHMVQIQGCQLSIGAPFETGALR